jgi:hypothetical protein
MADERLTREDLRQARNLRDHGALHRLELRMLAHIERADAAMRHLLSPAAADNAVAWEEALHRLRACLLPREGAGE